ncbi:MAG: 50S ribosomal protein L4 [Elusimicrobia bacterium]|nr:50S ribosomal protein L4 [Elusimicrobiota bacterium]
MKQLDVIDLTTGSPTGEKLTVPEALASIKPNKALLHEVVIAYQSNARRGTHATLTRGEVSGGGKKPWKQKHTGRARAGSIRSPLWRKGGITFGPQPRSYRIDVGPVKRQTAFVHALAARLNEAAFQVVLEENLANIEKTKELHQLLHARGLDETVVLVSEPKPTFLRAARNLQSLSVRLCDSATAVDILTAKSLVVTRKAWDRLVEVRLRGL